MQLLRLHRDVRGLLDQGVDVDFVLVVGPNILEIDIIKRDESPITEVPGVEWRQ